MSAPLFMSACARPARWGFRSLALLALAGGLAFTGCSSAPDSLAFNARDHLSTSAGQALTADMFLGTWDLDGRKTNTANGEDHLVYIASDVLKSLVGRRWEFQPEGKLRVDRSVWGTWRLDGPNTLVVQEQPTGPELTYIARFNHGNLYLRPPQGRRLVFARPWP